MKDGYFTPGGVHITNTAMNRVAQNLKLHAKDMAQGGLQSDVKRAQAAEPITCQPDAIQSDACQSDASTQTRFQCDAFHLDACQSDAYRYNTLIFLCKSYS